MSSNITDDQSGLPTNAGEGPGLNPVAGKGRPTPKRSESVRKRTAVKAPQTRKEALALAKQKRRDESVNLRAAMRSGDPSKLPASERTPEKILARDLVDTRRNLASMTFPVLVPLFVVGNAFKTGTGGVIASTALLVGMLAVLFDSVRLYRLVGRELAARIPGSNSRRSTGFYALSRAAMFRKLRTPAARVKVGDAIPK